MAKVVRTQSKGMVTIPIEYRRKLGIGTDCLLEVRLIDDGIVFIPVRHQLPATELYSDVQVKEWMNSDRMDASVVRKLQKLLKSA